MSYRTGTFWQPDVTVATVVERDGHLLMVEERVAGRLVYNQPAGYLGPGESILQGAVRETHEETGWQVNLTAFIGAYQWQAPETEALADRHRSPFGIPSDCRLSQRFPASAGPVAKSVSPA